MSVYFLLWIPIFACWELAFRVYAMGLSLLTPGRRIRRFNLLTRKWGVLLTQLTRHVLGVRISVRGTIPEGRYVVVSNHQSTADIPILFWVFRDRNCKFVAKKELGRGIPTISVAISRGGFGLIGREASRADLRALRDMGRGLETWDASAVIFPEGTRSDDGNLLPYRSAAVKIVARESGLPLLPCSIDGTWAGKDLKGFVRGLPGSRVEITIGEPVFPDRYAGRFDEILRDIERWTSEVLEEGRQSGRMARPPDPLRNSSSARR